MHSASDRLHHRQGAVAAHPMAAGWLWASLALSTLIWAASVVVGFQLALAAIVGLAYAAVGASLVLPVIGVRAPAVGLLGVSVLCTTDVLARVFLSATGFVPLPWSSLNVWLTLVALLSAPLLLRLSDLSTRLFELLVLLIGLHIWIVADRPGAVLDMLGVVAVFGLLAYAGHASNNQQAWYWMGLINGVLAGAGSLAFYLERDALPYINKNALAFFPLSALFAICLALPAARHKRGVRRTLSVLALINTGWVFLTGSRGGVLVAGVCLLYVLMSIRDLPTLIGVLASGVVFGVVVNAWFADQQALVLHGITRLLDPGIDVGDRTNGRSDLALGGWYIFVDHPLGVGTNGFAAAWAALGLRPGLFGFHQGEPFPPHSAWVKALAENGVVGIGLLAAYVASFAWVGVVKHRMHPDLLALGVVTTAAIGLAFLSTEFQSKAVWFLAAGSTVVLHRDAIQAHRWAARRRRPIAPGIVRPHHEQHQ